MKGHKQDLTKSSSLMGRMSSIMFSPLLLCWNTTTPLFFM